LVSFARLLPSGPGEVLGAEMLKRLLKECKVLEAEYGTPQDIEFSFSDDEELFILQSRPITTLFPIDKLEHDGKLRAYLGAGTALLGMKEPFTPMGFDIMSNMFPAIINVMTSRNKDPLRATFVRHAGGRMYVDMTYLLASKFVAKQFANAFSGNDLPLKSVMYDVINKYGKVFSNQGIRLKIPWGIMKYGIQMIPQALRLTKIPNTERYDAMIAYGNALYQKAEMRAQQLNTIKEKILFAEDTLVQAFKVSQTQALYCLDISNLAKIEKGLKKHFGKEFVPEVLVQSLPRCFTQTLMVRLNEYAKYCHEKDLKPSADHPMFLNILSTYGHRANMELDLGTKRWHEDSSYLLGLVHSYLKDGTYQKNLDDYEQKRQQAEDMIETVYARLKDKVGQRNAQKFKQLIINYRIAAGMREYPKSDIVRFMDLSRKELLSVGEELVANGKLEDKYDVFMVYKEDILEGRELKPLVVENRALYSAEMHRTRIPRIVLNNGATYYSSTSVAADARVLTGMPLSPGSYEGAIRVVYDPTSTELKDGEVMVTESTNPAWTPLFATAGALIMEYGGPMSHGGIVAREYGIPAVVGISGATGQLRDGQRVRVNGESGVVELLD